MSNKDDELAALKARVEELERKAKPPEPEKPFVPEPYQRYDPTAGMSMPPSALRAMVEAEPRGFMKGVLRDNQAPTGPSSQGVIPSSQQLTGVHVGGKGSGWVDPRPLRNPEGTFWVDAIAIADEVRQRKERERGG
jgi:hypothetical protein